MKIIVFSIILFLALDTFAQADNICGYYITLKGNTQVHITKGSNGRYNAKVVWLRYNKERKDSLNPSPQLRSRKILGMLVMNNFLYNPKRNKWFGGTVYDPETGNTYMGEMWFEKDPRILKLKGYVPGLKIIHREITWIKVNGQKE